MERLIEQVVSGADRLLSTAEVVERLGLTNRNALYRQRGKGALSSVRVAGRLRWFGHEVALLAGA